jgi:hypothetical protein
LTAALTRAQAENARLNEQLQSPWLSAEAAAERAMVPVTVINRARREHQIRFNQYQGPGSKLLYTFHRDDVDAWKTHNLVPTVEQRPAPPSYEERQRTLVLDFVEKKTRPLPEGTSPKDCPGARLLYQLGFLPYLESLGVSSEHAMSEKPFAKVLSEHFPRGNDRGRTVYWLE